jgi:hypothetical protein
MDYTHNGVQNKRLTLTLKFFPLLFKIRRY